MKLKEMKLLKELLDKFLIQESRINDPEEERLWKMHLSYWYDILIQRINKVK